MFDRILILVLIATLALCPLCCSLGLCHDIACDVPGLCCATDHVERDLSESCEDSYCCAPPSREPSGDSPIRQDREPCEDGPCEDGPCRDTCQGICGGAVPCRDSSSLSSALDTTPFDIIPFLGLRPATPNSPALGCRWRISDVWVYIGLSPGRRICTLHMCWLC